MRIEGASSFDHAGQDTVTAVGLPMITRYEETIRRAAIVAALYLLPAMWILLPVILDPDIWWHLQAGKWIVEHGTLPGTDPFSAYGEGKLWVAYSWLFEVGMYGVVRAFGESGIVLYTLAGAWLIILTLHRIIGSRCSEFLVGSGLLAVSIVALSNLFTPRPWLLTILFFAITMEVVLAFREGKQSRWFWFLPLVYIVWANIHIQFIYGLGLLGLACIAPLIDRWLQPFVDVRSVMVAGSLEWKRLLGVTALCVLATLFTPYHVRLYSIVFELSAQTGMWEYAQEMQAPAFRSVADWAVLGLFSFTLVRLGRRRSWSSFEVLFLCVAAVFAFRGQRDIWFLALACLASIVSNDSQSNAGRRSMVSPHIFGPALLFVIIGAICIVGFRGVSESKILENTGKQFPAKAAAFVEAQRYTGRLYNHFNWGGYLIWRLPHLKVSMDGRANVHGDARIKQSIKTWNGESHWSEDLELDGAGVVIAQKNMALSSLLRLDPRFQLTYQDEIAVVFVRVRDGKE